MAGTTGLTGDERAELTALRAEVAALRATTAAVPGGRGSRAGHVWRWVACGLLFTFAALLVLGGVAARFVRSELLDTDRYVQTVAPIGADPAVQAQLTDLVVNAVMDGLNLEAVTEDALTALADSSDRIPDRVAQRLPQLAPLIAGGAENLVRREVSQFLASDRFETLWIDVNRAAHKNLVSVLTGEGDTALQADRSGTVTLSLGPVIDQVKERLVARGITIADSIPALNPQFVVMQSDDLVKAQRAVRLLDRAADVLPLLALAFGVLGVLAAPRGYRRRATTVLGLVVAATMVVLGLAINVGRSLYLGAVPTDVLAPPAAEAVFDPVVEPLRWMLRAVLVLGLAVAVAGYLTGSSHSAVALRRGVASLVARVRGRTRTPTAFEVWVGRYRRFLQIGLVVLGALVLVSWNYPSGSTVAWIAVLTGLLVLAVYVVGAPAPVLSAAASAGPQAAPPEGPQAAPEAAEPPAPVAPSGR